MNQLTEELRLLKLGLPLKAVAVFELLLDEIGRPVSQETLMSLAGCTRGMLANYISLLRQKGCMIHTQPGQGFMLEQLPGGEEPTA